MKTKTIKIYSFSELDPKIQTKVLDKFRDINIDDDFWHEWIFENMISEIKEKTGLEIDPKKIEWEIMSRTNKLFIPSDYLVRLLSGKYSDLLSFNLPKKFGVYTDYMGGGICSNLKESEYNLNALTFEFYGDDDSLKNITKKKTYSKEIAENLDFIMQSFKKSFSCLYETYEDSVSDERVKETIELNDYEFTEDGVRA